MNSCTLVLILITAAATALAPLPAQAQADKLFQDGYDWQKLDRITREVPELRLPLKRAFLSGLLDGQLYTYLQTYAAQPSLADSLYRGYLSRVTPDELIRGTDAFYEDPRNLYLPVVSALAITSLRAAGLPDSVVVDFTAASREWINRLTLLTTELPNVPLEGINKPAAPRTPAQLDMLQGTPPPRKWYNPRRLILP